MTDIEQRAREMLIDACRYCGVEVPPGYLLVLFDADSGPWMVAQRLAQLAALQSLLSPPDELVEAMARGICRRYVHMGDIEPVVQDRVDETWHGYVPDARAALASLVQAMGAGE